MTAEWSRNKRMGRWRWCSLQCLSAYTLTWNTRTQTHILLCQSSSLLCLVFYHPSPHTSLFLNLVSSITSLLLRHSFFSFSSCFPLLSVLAHDQPCSFSFFTFLFSAVTLPFFLTPTPSHNISPSRPRPKPRPSFALGDEATAECSGRSDHSAINQNLGWHVAGWDPSYWKSLAGLPAIRAGVFLILPFFSPFLALLVWVNGCASLAILMWRKCLGLTGLWRAELT